SEELVSRFKGCEDLTLPAPDGGPLVFCAISDGISVSFPSATIWDADRVKVRFLEIREDGEIEEVEEEIDNLSCSQHAFSINDRHQSRPKDIVDPRELWERRAELFPNLLFGSDVRSNFMTSASLLGTIVGKLSALDRTAKDWRVRGGGMPEWRTLVSPESNTKMKNKKFQSSRTFRSHNGEQEIFEWHARFGDSGRIHLRFDTEEREIEIGYIGSHLPN
ncbi:MAG: hypothetical protein OXF56_16385, partial [Rhodobacteraceae bacterium]|nr:hypothetical protein [Paracoccaceae bacterium]